MRNFPHLFAVAALCSVRLYAQCGPIGNDPLADKTCWLNNGAPSISIKPGAQIGGTLWPTLIQAQSFFAGYSEHLPNSPLIITSGTDSHDPADSGCGHVEGCKVDFRIADQNWNNTAADSVSQFIIMNRPPVGCRSNDNAPKWMSTVGISGGSVFAMEKSTPPYPPCKPYQGYAIAPHWDFLTSLQQITTPWDSTQGLSVEVGQTASVSPTAYGTQGQIPMQPGMFEYAAPENGDFGDALADIDASGNVTGLNVGSLTLYVSAGSDCGFGQVVPTCTGIVDVVAVTITANNPPGGGPKCVAGVIPAGGCWSWDPSIGGWVWNPGNSGTGGNNPPGNPPNGGQICSSLAVGPCWQWNPRANNGGGAWIFVPASSGSGGTTTTPPITPVSSLDPNAISGPTGSGTSHYISGTSPTGYIVFFENEPTATAPAQKVVVTDQIDVTRFDPSSVTLGPITFPGTPGVVPPGFPLQALGGFSTQVDLRPITNLLVNVSVSLNASGLLAWTLQSLDPNTGLPPTDPLVGVLPPGGDGSVSFSAALKPSLTTGTIVTDQATVVFDVNAPIVTPIWSNTIDNTKPTGHVNALPVSETTTAFLVSWTASDLGGGVNDTTVYASDNGGSFTPWQQNATKTSALFTGVSGHSYGFYSIARDQVGNVESGKTTSEASTRVLVDTTPPLIAPQITGTLGNNGWYRSAVTVNWGVSDPESGIASLTGCISTPLTADTAGVTLTCSATNGAGLSTSVPVTIKIDKTPPVISGMPAAGCSLWPPNHKFVRVGDVKASDALSGFAPGSLKVTGSSNEPSDPNNPDVVITPDGSGGFVVQLRAERSGSGDGRVYTLNANAMDNAGNSATATSTCTVPHDQGK